MPKLHRLRLNPSADDARVARAMAILEDTSLDPDVAADLANRILAGEEIAEALTGTGLVVDTSPQPAQIAEVQTAQGIVEVPVTEAVPPSALVEETYAATDVDPSQFYIDGEFNLVKAFRALGEAEGLLEDYLRSLPESEIKAIVKQQYGRSRIPPKGSKDELIAGLVREAEARAFRGHEFLNLDADRPSVDEAVRAIDAARNLVATAPRYDYEGAERLREELQHLLNNMSRKDLVKVAQHYKIYLQRTPTDKRAKRIVEGTVGMVLRNQHGPTWSATTASPDHSIYSALPSLDDFIQKRIDFWNRRYPETIFTLEKLKEYHDKKPDTIEFTASMAESDVRNSTVAAAVHRAAQTFLAIAKWYGPNTRGFTDFERRAREAEAKAMQMFRAEYEKKYGVSPPRSNPRFIRHPRR